MTVDTLDNVLIPVAVALKKEKPSVSGSVNSQWRIGGGMGPQSTVEHRNGEIALQFTNHSLARITATIDDEIQVPVANVGDSRQTLYLHTYTPTSIEEYQVMMDKKNAWFGDDSEQAKALAKDAVWYCMLQIRAFAF
jgi:hypothetical protein